MYPQAITYECTLVVVFYYIYTDFIKYILASTAGASRDRDCSGGTSGGTGGGTSGGTSGGKTAHQLISCPQGTAHIA